MSERRPNRQGAAELDGREVCREHLSQGGGWAQSPAPVQRPGLRTGAVLACPPAALLLCQHRPLPCRCRELPTRFEPKVPGIRGCSSALDQLPLPSRHVLACSGALGDPTGGFLARAEAEPWTARGEGQILPCRLTLHEPEDRKI